METNLDQKLGEAYAAGRRAGIAEMLSGGIATDQGTMPLVGTGEFVGLRVESAATLQLRWLDNAAKLLSKESREKDIHEKERLRSVAETYDACADELRRQMAAETVRQPEPNHRGSERPARAFSVTAG